MNARLTVYLGWLRKTSTTNKNVCIFNRQLDCNQPSMSDISTGNPLQGRVKYSNIYVSYRFAKDFCRTKAYFICPKTRHLLTAIAMERFY